MKEVSIRELHQHTGKLVRQAQKEPIVVTDRGQQIAVLKSITGEESFGKPFPKRKLSSLPKVRVDSTIYISEERDDRNNLQPDCCSTGRHPLPGS
jgi:prevent-host-death family protein